MQLKVVIWRVPNKIMCEGLGAGNPNWDLSISSLYGLKSSNLLPTGIEFFCHHGNIKLGFQNDHEVSSHFCPISLSLSVLLLSNREVSGLWFVWWAITCVHELGMRSCNGIVFQLNCNRHQKCILSSRHTNLKANMCGKQLFNENLSLIL